MELPLGPRLVLSAESDDPLALGLVRERWGCIAERYADRAPLRFRQVDYAFRAELSTPKAAASLLGRGNPDEWLIEVNTRWFALQTVRQQELTLLHEWIHLRFMNGDLKARYLEAWGPSRYCCDAMRLWNYIHEVAAEYHLLRFFPELRHERANYLVEMAMQDAGQGPKGNPGWWAFYQLLRLDLAEAVNGELLMAETVNRRKEAEVFVAQHLDSYEAVALRRRMLAVELEPFRYDADAFDVVRDRIQAIHSSS